MKVPDVSVSRMRRDFGLIFDAHKKTTCKVIRFDNAGSGDFFDEDGSKNYETIIAEISIQGTSDSIERMIEGIEMPKGTYRCYVKHDTILRATDLININGRMFKINNLQDNIKSDSIIFQSFNLEFSSNEVYD